MIICQANQSDHATSRDAQHSLRQGKDTVISIGRQSRGDMMTAEGQVLNVDMAADGKDTGCGSCDAIPCALSARSKAT